MVIRNGHTISSCLFIVEVVELLVGVVRWLKTINSNSSLKVRSISGNSNPFSIGSNIGWQDDIPSKGITLMIHELRPIVEVNMQSSIIGANGHDS